MSRSGLWHYCFLLGSFRVQTSIRKTAVLIGVLRGLPQSLEAKAMKHPSIPAHSLIILSFDAIHSCWKKASNEKYLLIPTNFYGCRGVSDLHERQITYVLCSEFEMSQRVGVQKVLIWSPNSIRLSTISYRRHYYWKSGTNIRNTTWLCCYEILPTHTGACCNREI
jgi:hypothetical protein